MSPGKVNFWKWSNRVVNHYWREMSNASFDNSFVMIWPYKVFHGYLQHEGICGTNANAEAKSFFESFSLICYYQGTWWSHGRVCILALFVPQTKHWIFCYHFSTQSDFSLSGSFAKNRGHFHLNDCTYLLKTRSGINTDEFWGHFAFLFWREIFQALNEVDSTNGQTVFNCALQVIQPHWDVKCIAHFICSLCLMFPQSMSYQVWANHIFWHFHNSTSFDLGFKVFAVFEFSLLSRFFYFFLSARI